MCGITLCNEVDFTDSISSKSVFAFEPQAIITPAVTQRTGDNIPSLICRFVAVDGSVLQEISAAQDLGIEIQLV